MNRSPATAPHELSGEHDLSVLRQRFEHTDDPQARSELAAEALDVVLVGADARQFSLFFLGQLGPFR